MKVALLVCALVATAVAGPRYKRATTLDAKLSQHVRLAEEAWTAAEQATADQAAQWEHAAEAFAAIDGDAVDPKVKRDAALAAVLAWKNAGEVHRASRPASSKPPTPRELPVREQHLIAAMDRYAAYASDPNDAELSGALFLKARTYYDFDQLDTAIPIFKTIIARFPRHEVGAFAAQLLLDAYNQLRRFDELVALADQLAKDKSFLRDRDDLTATVVAIQRAAQRRRAEGLEREANDTRDWTKYAAAGTAYLDIYNAAPSAPDGDEVLYNAGVAFSNARAIAAAIQAFELLVRRYPNSKLAARALARLGRTYADIANYARAAEKLESYATKYAGEKDAYDAMTEALYYRKAIGDRAKVIEDTKYLIRTYGAKRPSAAADAMWSLTAVYEGNAEEMVAHLREYVRMFGSKGGADRIVIAHAKMGHLLATQSCAVPLTNGLCVTTAAAPARRCDTKTAGTLTPSTRNASKVKDAVGELTAAIKEFERQRFDDPTARYYYAQAKLSLADLDLEAYLGLAFPRNLDFDPARRAVREASMKRFSGWIDAKTKAGGQATRAYEEVLATKDTASSIAAAERLALLAQTFAAELQAGEIPRVVRQPDQVKAFCDTLTVVAEPLQARAIQSYAACLAKSTELGWFGESSAECERQLSRMKPDEFPRAVELRPAPLFVAPVVAAEPIP